MNIRNPYLLGTAGVPLVASVAAGTDSETAQNIRRATGLTSLIAAGVWAWTKSEPAKNAAIGAGASWAVLRLGIL